MRILKIGSKIKLTIPQTVVHLFVQRLDPWWQQAMNAWNVGPKNAFF